jgi:hypothetical protein
MEKVDKITVTLPRNAFHQNPRAIHLELGDHAKKLHTFIRDTKAGYTYQSPVLDPRIVHLSSVECGRQDFKLQDIVTVNINIHQKISQIRVRKPFESSPEN